MCAIQTSHALALCHFHSDKMSGSLSSNAATTQFLVTISPPKRSTPLQSSQLYIPRRTTTPDQENPVVKLGEDTRFSSP